MCDLIVSVPGHCSYRFTFKILHTFGTVTVDRADSF